MSQHQNSLNKHGNCPNCEGNLDGGDVLQTISALSCFQGKSDTELKQIAGDNYGYTESNKTRFTKLISIEPKGEHEGKAFWKCPHCYHVWDKFTGDHFASLRLALEGEAEGMVYEEVSEQPAEVPEEPKPEIPAIQPVVQNLVQGSLFD